MVSKAKMRRRAKRAAVKKKYADVKAQKAHRVDERIEAVSKILPPEGLRVDDEELNRKFFRSLKKYKNKGLME